MWSYPYRYDPRGGGEMTICDGKGKRSHEEIVFEGLGCPLCLADDLIETLQAEVDSLTKAP